MELRVLGVMTGTSCDGLDAACLSIRSNSWKLLWKDSAPYPKKLRSTVLHFQKSSSKHTSQSWLEIHRDLGDWYCSALRQIINSHQAKPDVVANHGQTVAHFPNMRQGGMTLQLGESTRIAARTGLTVISNFRDGDLSAGGEGAPLAPLFHRILARQLKLDKMGVSIHNIGGISNLSYIFPTGKILAFDTGPGNIWIDAAVEEITGGRQKFDKNGEIAKKVSPDLTAISKILKHPYFRRSAPKSTGRDEFPFAYFLKHISQKDRSMVASATEVTIRSICSAYKANILNKNLPLKTILFCGGGAKNPTLIEGIQKMLPQTRVSTLESFGHDSQYIEAQAFAVYGFLALLGEPISGEWTGAKGYAPPGHIIPGENWNIVQSKMRKLEANSSILRKNLFLD